MFDTYSDYPKASWKKCVVGIDFGSTGIRVVLIPKGATSTFYPVQYRNCGPGLVSGDFPASCCPFRDDRLNYVGDKAIGLPDSQSIKYLMYHLGSIADGNYPLSKKLREQKNDPSFTNIAVTIIEKCFEKIRDHAELLCIGLQLEHEEIALSVPGQWAQAMLDIYADIISRVFHNLPVDNIHWANESEALLHFILKQHNYKLIPQPQPSSSTTEVGPLDMLLVIDFGGHSTDCCLYKLPRSEGEVVMQLEMTKYFYAPGGTELWKYKLGEAIATYLKDEHNVIDSDNARANYYIENFFLQLSKQDFNETMCSQSEDKPPPKFFCEDQDTKQILPLTLPWRKIFECYDEAFKEPMKLARERIQYITKEPWLAKSRAGVVLSGGSIPPDSKGRKDLTVLCQRYGCAPIFVEDLGSTWRSHNIAHGAALSITIKPDLGKLLEAGVGIGLESTPRKKDMKAQGTWCIWTNKNGSRKLNLDISAETDITLVCDPIFAKRESSDLCDWYELISLGSRPAGSYSFTGWVEKRKDGHWLLVKETKKVKNRRRRESRYYTWTKSVPEATREFPLHRQSKDAGLHIDVDKMTRIKTEEESRVDKVLPFDLDAILNPETEDEAGTPGPTTRSRFSQRNADEHTTPSRTIPTPDEDTDDTMLLLGKPTGSPVTNLHSNGASPSLQDDIRTRRANYRRRLRTESVGSNAQMASASLRSPVSPPISRMIQSQGLIRPFSSFGHNGDEV